MSRSVKSELLVGMSSGKGWSLEKFVRESGVPQSSADAEVVEHPYYSSLATWERSRCLVPLDTDSYKTAVGSKLQPLLPCKKRNRSLLFVSRKRCSIN